MSGNETLPLLESQEVALKILNEAIDNVNAGKTMEVVIVQIFCDETYQLTMAGNHDQHETAGMLLEAAIRRISPSNEQR